jgi:hypothetical protein
MDLQILIIIIVFLLAYIDKITTKSDEKRKRLKKYFNLRSLAICLIIILAGFQIFDYITQSQKDKVQEEKITETNLNVKKSQERLDSLYENIQIQIKSTEKEIGLLSNLNIDLKDARKNISKNLNEYEKINILYSEQLELEKKKILTDKPIVDIGRPITLSDSNYVMGQFQLNNSGQRLADNVKFLSIMVLFDSLNTIVKLTELKTNHNDQNILRISSNSKLSQYINYIICKKKEVDKYRGGFLIVKLSYYDLMLDSTITSPANIYQCSNLLDLNKQYGFNVPQLNADKIKNYIRKENLEIYDLFWDE